MRVAKQRKTQNLRKYQEIVETPYNDSPSAQSPYRNEIFSNTSKNP